MVKSSVMRVSLILAVVGLLWTGVAQAQDQPAPTTPTTPTAAPDAPGGGGANAMAAQIGGMIGGAEFLLILDKPFEAEKLFGAILQMDPNNEYAKQGLKRVAFAKKPNWTFLIHPFKFSLDAWMLTYGGGPSFYTKNLKSTFWIGDGFYKNDINPNNPDNPLAFLGYQIGTADDKALRKQTLNATFEPYYKQFDGYFFLNRTIYQEAPSRTLYYFKGSWNRQPGRESYAAFIGQHDSYYQNELAQFFAPESWTAVQEKILSREQGASATVPIGRFVDLGANFSHFNYTDGNTRRLGRFTAMYRILPSARKQMPILRVGASATWDDGDFASTSYYMPLSFHQYQISADYTYISGNTRYGVYGNWPVTDVSGEGFGRFPPTRTFYTFVNHKFSPGKELWVKFAGMATQDNGPRFGDLVVGMNVRFGSAN